MTTEPETEALRSYLEDSPRLLVSSLATVEVTRALKVRPEDGTATAREVLARCTLFQITDEVLREAARLAGPLLRSLDAIHLATALQIQPAAMLSYDRRLSAAARDNGLTVASPSLTSD